MKYRLTRTLGCFLVTLATVFLPAYVNAQFGFTATSSIEYIENPQRQGASDETDLLSSTTLNATLLRQTKYFDSNLNYSANQQEYRDNLLNDRSRVEGNGSITWNAIPEFFSWRVANMRSNQLVDAAGPNTPDNRQIIDYTSTGPIFNLPIGNSTLVNFGADYGVVGYEESRGQEQNRSSYNLSVSRVLTQRLTGSIRSSYTDVDFDNPLLSAYTFYSLAANVQLNSEDYTLSAEVGQYNSERFGQSSSHPTFTLSALYRVNSQFEVSGEYSRSVDDLVSNIEGSGTVDQFFQDSGPELGNTFGNTNNSNFYERESQGIGATYTAESAFSLSLRYTSNQRSSIGLIREENDERLTANFRLPLPQQPRLTINSSAQFSKRSISAARGIQDRTELRLGANYKLIERLNLTFSMSNVKQVGDLAIDNFDGLNVSLGLTFTRQAQ